MTGYLRFGDAPSIKYHLDVPLGLLVLSCQPHSPEEFLVNSIRILREVHLNEPSAQVAVVQYMLYGKFVYVEEGSRRCLLLCEALLCSLEDVLQIGQGSPFESWECHVH